MAASLILVRVSHLQSLNPTSMSACFLSWKAAWQKSNINQETPVKWTQTQEIFVKHDERSLIAAGGFGSKLPQINWWFYRVQCCPEVIDRMALGKDRAFAHPFKFIYVALLAKTTFLIHKPLYKEDERSNRRWILSGIVIQMRVEVDWYLP